MDIPSVGFVFPNKAQGNDDFSGGFYLHRLRPGIEEPKSLTTFRQPILEAGPQALFPLLEEKWAEAHLLKVGEAHSLSPFSPHIEGHFGPFLLPRFSRPNPSFSLVSSLLGQLLPSWFPSMADLPWLFFHLGPMHLSMLRDCILPC